MGVSCACLAVYHMCAWCFQMPEEGRRSLGTVVTDSCGLPCGYWGLNPGPLEELPLLLTANLSLQPSISFFNVTSFPSNVPSPLLGPVQATAIPSLPWLFGLWSVIVFVLAYLQAVNYLDML